MLSNEPKNHWSQVYIRGKTVDDLLRRVFSKIFNSGSQISPTRGKGRELFGVLLELSNPRARLSRTESKGTIFSCLGELLWYLAKSDDVEFISYYLRRYKCDSEDGRTIYGAYGPRLFGLRQINQVRNVLNLLRERPSSRRAVIQLFDAVDIESPHKEVPCTCSLQYAVRNGKLNAMTHMRSNDAYKGLPHDIFTFTMLQEVFARTLGVELGSYKHSVGSLHLYDEDRKRAKRYLGEGWQESDSMPAMPQGDPWLSIASLLDVEASIRGNFQSKIEDLTAEPYWKDLAFLLLIFSHRRNKRRRAIAMTRRKLSTPFYDTYISRKSTRPSE
jgi:thymidylate synthase